MRVRTRLMRTLGAAVLAAPLALAAAAAPAGAGVEDPLEGICGESPQPGDADGIVATLSDDAGNEVWNVTAEDQTLGQGVPVGDAVRFFVEYENDDDITHDIVVRADLDGVFPPPGFVIKVLRITNGKDVTDKVFGFSGLRLRDVPDGEDSPELVFRVKRKTAGPINAFVRGFVTGNYEVASACGDTVSFFGGDPN